MARSAAATAAILACGAAQAGEVSVGLGWDDVFARDGASAAAVSLQAQTDPLAALGPFGFGLGASAEADTDGDLWAGAGGIADLPLRNAFRLSGSVMVGGYAAGDGGDRLGSGLEFRTRLGVNRAIGDGLWSLGVAVEHKSNAGIGDFNPGIETLFVTVGRSY